MVLRVRRSLRLESRLLCKDNIIPESGSVHNSAILCFFFIFFFYSYVHLYLSQRVFLYKTVELPERNQNALKSNKAYNNNND